MSLEKNKGALFYVVLTLFAVCASAAHTGREFQFVLYAIVIIAPLLFDDTKTIGLYFFSACFMKCFVVPTFLGVLNISLLVLEVKKIWELRKNKNELKAALKIIAVWIGILILATIYTLFCNNFKFYRGAPFIDFIQCILTYFLVRNNLKIKDILLILFGGIVVSVGIAVIFNLIGEYNPFIRGSINERFGAFFKNVNTLGTFCTICASGIIVLIINKKLDFKKFAILPFILTLIGLAPFSKIFIALNTVLYVGWFVTSFVKSNHKKRYIIYLLMLIGLGFLVYNLSQDYIQVMVERFVGRKSNRTAVQQLTSGRIRIWEEYLDMWLKSPLTILFGNGYTSPKIPCGRYEHSLYLSLLNQFGIIGTIIIISAVVYTVRKGCKLSKNIINYVPVILLLINGLVSNMSGGLCTCLSWLFALCFVIDNKNKQKD